jgi:hypothetical protein
MDKITPERLLEIEARANAATPAPWEPAWNWDRKSNDEYTAWAEGPISEGGSLDKAATKANNDKDFIANSRQDIPDLIAALREAREVVIDADSRYNKPPKRQDYDVAKYTLRALADAGWKRIEEAEELRRKLAEAREDSENLYKLVELAYNVNPAYEYEFATGMKAHRDLLEKQS